MHCLFFLICLVLPYQLVSGKGTTPDIESIFLGRCEEYMLFKAHKISPKISKKDCKNLLATFKAVFEKETKCGDDYSTVFDAFFKAADPGQTEKDKALFWSGTKDIADVLGEYNEDYVTVKDTLPGHIANELNFCGEDTKGFNYKDCTCKWTESQMYAFWTAASVQFAKNAQGEIGVLVRATRKDGFDAYSPLSFFGKAELPNLDEGKVTKAKILVAVDLDEKSKETCGAGSIKTLEDDIKKQKPKIQVECIDDPRIVQNVLCVEYGTDKNCQRKTK